MRGRIPAGFSPASFLIRQWKGVHFKCGPAVNGSTP